MIWMLRYSRSYKLVQLSMGCTWRYPCPTKSNAYVFEMATQCHAYLLTTMTNFSVQPTFITIAWAKRFLYENLNPTLFVKWKLHLIYCSDIREDSIWSSVGWVHGGLQAKYRHLLQFFFIKIQMTGCFVFNLVLNTKDTKQHRAKLLARGTMQLAVRNATRMINRYAHHSH